MAVLPASARHLLAVERRVGRNGRLIEHEDVLGEAAGNEIDLEAGELLGGDLRPRVQEHLEPDAETIRVEPFVRAWRARAPEIEIEDARQLRGRRERDDLRARLEPAGLDHAIEDFGLQARDDRRQVRGVQQAGQQRSRLRHGTADITGTGGKETVLNPDPNGGRILVAIEGSPAGPREGLSPPSSLVNCTAVSVLSGLRTTGIQHGGRHGHAVT